MPVSDLDIYRSANTWLELHGDEAIDRARGMVTTFREKGDADGADTWLRIIAAIEELRLRAPGEGRALQ